MVTGAGRGIGAAAAYELALLGCEVVLISRSEEEIADVASTVLQGGGRARIIVCDVTKSVELRAAIADLPQLDILVNNAGANIPEPFLDVSDEHLDAILELNVRAAFVAAQASAKKMLAEPRTGRAGGSIVNVSSQMGHVGAPNRSVYSMTKHAIEGLTKALAVELAPYRIRVNAVAPTFVTTPMTKAFFDEDPFREWVLSRIPLGRIGRIDEVSAAIAFLASPAAALITGASLLVDGGWTAQ